MLILFVNRSPEKKENLILFFLFDLVGGENGGGGKNLGCKLSPRNNRIRVLMRRVLTRLTCYHCIIINDVYVRMHLLNDSYCFILVD